MPCSSAPLSSHCGPLVALEAQAPTVSLAMLHFWLFCNRTTCINASRCSSVLQMQHGQGFACDTGKADDSMKFPANLAA